MFIYVLAGLNVDQLDHTQMTALCLQDADIVHQDIVLLQPLNVFEAAKHQSHQQTAYIKLLEHYKVAVQTSQAMVLVDTQGVLCNLLGNLIAAEQLHPAQVKVLLVDDSNQVLEQVCPFDKDGQLVNWPYGFFMADSLDYRFEVKLS